jgi:predicted acetyltransferase
LGNIKLDHKKELEELLIEYFNEIDNSRVKGDSTNELNYPFFDLYWKDEKRQPFFIEYNNKNIGFALINDWVLNKQFNAKYSIAEFYIKPEYRRSGIGSKIVQELFTRFKGKWEIKQSSTNLIAIDFWRNCIDRFSKSKYEESIIESDDTIEFIQNFET